MSFNEPLPLHIHVEARIALSTEDSFEWEMIAENPFRGVRNFGVPKRDGRVLLANEEIKLLAACDQVRSRLLRPLIVLYFPVTESRGEKLLDLKKGFKKAYPLYFATDWLGRALT